MAGDLESKATQVQAVKSNGRLIAVIHGRLFRISALLALTVLMLTATLASAAKTKVTMATWYPQTEEDIERLISGFEAKNPDIEVEYQFIVWSGSKAYWDKVMTWAAAGTLPDVLSIPYVFSMAAIEQGLFTDITALAERDQVEFAFDDIMPPFDTIGLLDGRLYTIPYAGASVMWVSYNDRLFAEAGLSSPLDLADRGDWTLDAMLTMAERLTKFSGDDELLQQGINGMGIFSEGYTQWIWANGGEAMTGDRLALDQPRNIEIMDRLKEAIDKRTLAWALNPTTTGMLVWWDGIITYIQHFMNVENGAFDQVPFPSRAGVRPTGLVNANVVGITRQVGDLEAAWKLLTYLSNEGDEGMLSMVHGGVPVRKSQIPVFVELRQSYGIQGNRLFGTPLAAMRLGYRIPTEVEDIINTEISAIWRGEKTSNDALAEATRRGNAILESRYNTAQ